MTLQLVRPEELVQGQFENETSFAQRRERVGGQIRAYLESMPADTRQRFDAERQALADLERRSADARARADAARSQFVEAKVNGAPDATIAELDAARVATRREAEDLAEARSVQAEIVTAFEQRYLADRHAAAAAELEGAIAEARADYAQRFEALEPALATLTAAIEGLRDCAERERRAASQRARLEATSDRSDSGPFTRLPIPPANVLAKDPAQLVAQLRPGGPLPAALPGTSVKPTWPAVDPRSLAQPPAAGGSR